MLRIGVIASLFFISGLYSAKASAASGSCPAIRQANFNLKVEKLFYAQEQGSFKLKRETVCAEKGVVDVLGQMGSCVYPVLKKCNLVLDNEQHSITISGVIYNNENEGRTERHFYGGYHLDRNLGNVTTGEAGGADIFTPDLSLKKIGVNVQSKLDSYTPGAVLRDAVSVEITYEDSNAR